MDNPSSITTERLHIIPFREVHVTKQYIGWLNDPDVVRFSELRFRNHSRESCLEYMRSFSTNESFFWALFLKSTVKEHIGNISAYLDVNNRSADVAILLGEKSIWGHGYGREAFCAVVDYLFKKAFMRKVTAGTMSINQGMVRIMEKARMKPDGRRKGHFLREGKAIDLVHMALFREEYFSRNNFAPPSRHTHNDRPDSKKG